MKKINIERLCIVLSIAIVLFGAGVHLYRWWKVSSLEAEARAAEEKAAELERQAKEAEAKKEAEEKAQLAQEAEKVLQPLIAAIPGENQEEVQAIVEVLVALNKAQNTKDYRTMTGHEGEEYMTAEYRKKYAEGAEERVKLYQKDKSIVTFKGLKILEVNINDTKTAAEVTYDLTVEENNVNGTETGTLRAKAFLVKENNKWLVNNEETLGRVADEE